MNRDDIKRLALEAGFEAGDGIGIWNFETFQRFAALVAAAEREEILKLSDALGWIPIEAVRARGEE